MSDDPTIASPDSRHRHGDGSDPRERVSVPDHVLRRVIGRGAYGEVWEARNVMGTPRAVKVVRRDDFESSRPFEREFEGIQRYEPVSRSHAGLVQVLHVGMSPAGDYFYYVMELADRAVPDDESADPEIPYEPKTLRSVLTRRDRLGIEECIELGLALAAALGHLHAAGLVHRDVKPSNIIYVNGVPKLADVGLVARLSDSRSVVGTEGYFAPEGTGQARSDVYSLGKVLYECVTGLDRLRFPDVPDAWGGGPEHRAAFEFMEIVLRAAEPDAARRYSRTEEVLSDLALLKAGKSLRHLRRVETRLKRAGQVLAVSGVAVALAAGAWLYERHRRGQVETAELAARIAQAETRTLLGESLVAQARAVRLSGQAGAREKALDAVRRGLQAGAPKFALRTEAASALALTDSGAVRPARSIASPGGLVQWTPDGSRAVVLSANARVRVVDRDSGREEWTFATGPDVTDLFPTRGGGHVAVLHADRRLVVWTAGRDGATAWESRLAPQAGRPAFSHDGSWIVASTPRGLEAIDLDGGTSVVLAVDAPAMRAILLAPDGTWIAALPVVDEESPESTDGGLGFRLYLGLPGSMPSEADAAGVRQAVIASDIRLEGPSISADSRYLAAAVGEDRLRVWEIPSLSQVAWLRGHQRKVRATAFHPTNPGLIASTSWDGTTRLWDIPTRQEVLVLPVGGEEIALLPERGELLLRTWAGDALRSAPLSTDSALRVLVLPPHTPFGLLSGVNFDPGGGLLAAAGDAGVIAWDLASGQPTVIQPSGGPQHWRDVVFSPDGDSILYSGRDGLLRRKIGRGTEAATLQAGPAETILDGFCGDLAWAGERLAISGRVSRTGNVGIALLAEDGTLDVLEAGHAPDQLATSRDGRWLAATRYPEGGGTLWDLSARPPTTAALTTATRAAFGFTDDASVLIAGTDREVTFTALAAAARPQAPAPPLARRDSEFTPGRSAASIAAGLVAVATGPTEITLCDHRTLRPLLALDSPLTPFDCNLAFSPDGSLLALAGGVSRVVVWDIGLIRRELEELGLGLPAPGAE